MRRTGHHRVLTLWIAVVALAGSWAALSPPDTAAQTVTAAMARRDPSSPDRATADGSRNSSSTTTTTTAASVTTTAPTSATTQSQSDQAASAPTSTLDVPVPTTPPSLPLPAPPGGVPSQSPEDPGLLPPLPTDGIVITVLGPSALPASGMCAALSNFFGTFATGRTGTLGTVVLSTAGVQSEVYINVSDCSTRRPSFTSVGETIPFRGGAPTGLILRTYSVGLTGGISGIALDLDGQPLANALIDLGPMTRTITASDGTFELWNVGTRVKLFAITPDYRGGFCDPVIDVPAGTVVTGVVVHCG